MCAQEHVARQTTKTPSGSQNHGSHRCLGQQTTRVLAASLPRRHKDPHTDATTAPTALTQLGLSSHVPYLNARLSPIRIARVRLCWTNGPSVCALRERSPSGLLQATEEEREVKYSSPDSWGGMGIWGAGWEGHQGLYGPTPAGYFTGWTPGWSGEMVTTQ